MFDPQNLFKAWITIDGVELNEYEVETLEQDGVVTCWIASELGKNFKVHIKNIAYEGELQANVYVDGIDCYGKIFWATGAFPKETWMDGLRDGTVVRNFVFSQLTVSDDDELLAADDTDHARFGTIEVRIYPVDIEGESYIPLPAVPEDRVVHEQSKKALTQHIHFEPPQAAVSKHYSTVRTGADIVIFKFKYRPLDVLRADGIILSERKVLDAEDDESEDEDAKEVDRLREQLRVAEAKLAAKRVDKKTRIKTEADDDLAPAAKRVKRLDEDGAPSDVVDLADH
ncbi:hypothetical protein MKEN_00726400 [Mycena kentingensis (nom. inval.)]|nr:hypothetical protein MKEN_00726400 [Mycena kentingensis (nom. inval.)]